MKTSLLQPFSKAAKSILPMACGEGRRHQANANFSRHIPAYEVTGLEAGKNSVLGDGGAIHQPLTSF